ncbi:MAG: response regulator [Pseudomonadota bacterium]
MAEQLKVMILDDEPTVGKRLGPALAKVGCLTETFVDPTEAMARLEQTEFDVVVTDIRMEKLDGIQVLERVLAKSPRTKVIVISGYATLEVARQALAKGAFDLLAKPFKPSDLREVIVRAAQSLGLALQE